MFLWVLNTLWLMILYDAIKNGALSLTESKYTKSHRHLKNESGKQFNQQTVQWLAD